MISKNDFWFQEIEFLMSENVIFLITRFRICDIKDNFLISRNPIFYIINVIFLIKRMWITDMKNYIFWYQKIYIFLYQKMTLISNFMYIFLKSENDFLILENRVFINENNRYYSIFCYQKIILWYQKVYFDIRILIFDIRKYLKILKGRLIYLCTSAEEKPHETL